MPDEPLADELFFPEADLPRCDYLGGPVRLRIVEMAGDAQLQADASLEPCAALAVPPGTRCGQHARS